MCLVDFPSYSCWSCVSSLEKYLLIISVHFKSGYLSLLRKKSSSYSPDVSSSLDTCSANIFFQFCRLYCFFFIRSVDTQKLSFLLMICCCCCCFSLGFYVQGFTVKSNVTKAQPWVTVLFF